MRQVDEVPFADTVEELEPSSERPQVERIVGDVARDYLTRAPSDFLASTGGREKAEEWARECAELQAIDSINTQRYLKAKGVDALTQLQSSGRLAQELLVETQLLKPPWE